jgi:hypothetical protein
MKFLSDILAKAGLTVDGVVTLNNTATGQTPAANDNSTKLATTAWVRTFVQPYSLPIASASILGGVKVGTGLSIDSGTGILSVTGASASSIKSTQTFVVTEGQTVFTVTNGYSVGLIDIFLNGVYLSPNQSTATNGSTFTLNDPAATGDIIDVIVVSPVYQGTSTTTDQLPEGVVNLYYTNARARAAITLTVNGSSGASSYSSSTGVLNVPTYTLAGLGGIGGSGTTGYVSKFTNSTTIGNSLIYDNGFGIGINTSSPYNSSFYSLDVNGALLVKNVGKAANITLINADPAGGGNNAFVIHTVGGTLTSSYVDIQGYYGASVTGSTTIRLNAAGGNILIGSLIGTGTRMVVAGSTGILSTQAIPTISDLSGVPTSRTITINGVTYDLTANRSWSALPVGGTAGQLLAKVDGTDYNAQWINEAPAASYTSQVKHQVKASQAITKGQAVYVSSADGTNMIVSKASNATEGTSSKTMGLLESTVSTNGFTNVIAEGLLSGLNTNGATAGDPVWLGTDGNLIYGLVNKPSAPAHLVFIGVVTRVNANNGEIFVKVQNGFEMNELHDYVESGVQNNFVISYESSTDLYKPKSIATLLGYTSANAARSLTINGTTYDLTADRTWTLTTSVIGEGTNLYYTDARVGTYLTANSYATQSYVSTQINNLVSGAPGLLDTLDELAAALGDDPNFATTVSTALSNRLRIDIGTQGLTSTQQGFGRTNLGLGSLATLSSVGNANITDLAYSKLTSVPSTFAPSAHTHAISEIIGLQTALDGKEPTITAGTTSQYWRGDKTWQTLPIYTLSGLGGQPQLNGTGFVKVSGTTVSYDNSTYLTTSSASSTYQTILTNPITGTGTAGQIAFFNGTSSIASEINLLWDSSNNRLGIGVTPTQALDIVGKIKATDDLILAQQNPAISFDNGASGTLRIFSSFASAAIATFNSTGGFRLNQYGTGARTGTRTYDLAVDSLGNVIEVAVGAGTITGGGTAGQVPYFSGTSSIGSDANFTYNNSTNVFSVNGWVDSYRRFRLYFNDIQTLAAELYEDGASTNGGTLNLFGKASGTVDTVISAAPTKYNYINNNANFGIGYSSDQSFKLAVNGSVLTNGALQVGSSGTTSINFYLTRTNGGVPADANYFVATANTPNHSWIEGGYFTGELAGVITAPNSGYPYYEVWAGQGSVTNKIFGFVNKTSGTFTSSDLLSVLILSRTGNVSVPNGAFSSKDITINESGSGILTIIRQSTGYGATVNFRTGGTLNWYLGTRGLVNNNFYIVNEALGVNNLILDSGTGAATFTSHVNSGGWFAAPNNYGLTALNAAGTAGRVLIKLNSSNQIEIGRDSDISAIRLGTASANGAVGIASNGSVEFLNRISLGGIGDQTYASLFIGGAVTSGTNQYAIILDPQLAGSSDNYGLFANARIRANTAVNNVFGVYIPSAERLSGATIVNNYALYIANQTSGSSVNYSIYSSGGLNYLGGRLGLRVTNPGATLDVSGDASLVANFNFSSNGTYARWQNNGTSFGDVGSAATLVSGGATNDFAIHARSTFNIIFSTDFSEKVRINSGGNVSIGNTNNTYKLDVTGTVNLGGGTIGATSGDLIIDTTSASPKVIIGRLSSANNDNTLLIGRNRVGTQGWQIDGFGAATFNSSLNAASLYTSGTLDVGMSPAPFWNARFRDYSDGSGVYISSVAAGGHKSISGDSYYQNSGFWYSNNTTSTVVNLTGGNFAVYTNSGLTANTNFTPTERFRINTSGAATFLSSVSLAGGSEGLRLGNVGDNSAYDNVKFWYTGYNGGGPIVYLTPRTTPGSGVLNTFLYLQNSNGTSTSSNNTMGLLVDGSVGIGTTNLPFKLNIESTSEAAARIKSTNASGAARLILNPEGAGAGSTGDASIFFDCNSTAWVTGVDKSDSSRFKIAVDPYGDFRAGVHLSIDNLTDRSNVVVGGTIALATAANRGSLTINGANNSILAYGTGGTLRGYLYCNGTNFFMNHGAGSYTFENDNATAMVITSGGFVGIRTTPTVQFAVNGSTNGIDFETAVTSASATTPYFTIRETGISRTVVGYNYESTTPLAMVITQTANTTFGLWRASEDAVGSTLRGMKSRGTANNPVSVNNGDTVFSIEGYAWHGAGPNHPKFGAGMRFVKDDAYGTANTFAPQRTEFYNANSITTTQTTFVINANGNVVATGDVTAYSDARVKTNINTIENALEKTMALRGVSYFRTDTDKEKRKIGVIAQEVRDILPELVLEDHKGNLSVSYGNMVGVLIEAIKEQQTQIESQKSEIEELKDLVKQLINR